MNAQRGQHVPDSLHLLDCRIKFFIQQKYQYRYAYIRLFSIISCSWYFFQELMLVLRTGPPLLILIMACEKIVIKVSLYLRWFMIRFYCQAHFHEEAKGLQRKLISNTKYMQLDLSISYQKRKKKSILYEVKKEVYIS